MKFKNTSTEKEKSWVSKYRENQYSIVFPEFFSTRYNSAFSTGKAFEILKTWVDGRFVLPKSRWYILMNEVVPKRGKHYADLLWQVLDEDGNNMIDKRR